MLLDQNTQITHRDIQELKVREDYHSAVHPHYFIPDWPASSMSNAVLKDMAKDASMYLKIPRHEVSSMLSRKQLVAKIPVKYMLDVFEDYLVGISQRPTGINRASPPNKDFVCRLINHMDPLDELGLFKEKIGREALASGFDPA
jgi:hypothetical protein